VKAKRYAPWVRFPGGWIERGGLKALRWAEGVGADNVAALIVLISLVQNADQDSGQVRITYDRLAIITTLSRPKISQGLKRLIALGVIERLAGQSDFALVDFSPSVGWSMLPAKRFYDGPAATVWEMFKLRRRVELDALKLYLLFVVRRDRNDNYAHLSYDRIVDYSGVDHNRIRPALSLLAANGLIHVEHFKSTESHWGVSNAYRIIGVDSYNHRGTAGRADAMDAVFGGEL
jgi:DNA-binding Lrp family transcriptional regulator